MGTVVAGALAFGGMLSPWLPVAGVVVAVAMGFVAVFAAWREHAAFRVKAAEESAADQRAFGAKLHDLHVEHTQVLDVLDRRNQKLRTDLATTRTEATELQGEVSQLREENGVLRKENTELRREVADLRGEAGADIVTLPRRRATRTEGLDRSGDASTVVDLQRLALPFVDDMLRRHAN